MEEKNKENLSLKNLIKQIKPSIVAISIPDCIIGSGFLVSNGSYAVTCEHVIRDTKELFISLPNIEPIPVKIAHFDNAVSKERDYAILKIEGKKFSSLELGSYDDIEEGEKIFTMGYPFGLSNVTHSGIVSYKGVIDFDDDIIKPSYSFLIDGTINSGNSGAPLISLKSGKAIGIVRAKYGRLSDYLEKIKNGELNCSGIHTGQVDLGKFLRETSLTIEKYIQMGIGYAVSIDYVKEYLPIS